MKLKGTYLVKVTATDGGGLSSSTVLDVSGRQHWIHIPCLVNSKQALKCAACANLPVLSILQIFTVDDSYKVELRFSASEIEVENKLPDIKR